jgi:hypothetical protein
MAAFACFDVLELGAKTTNDDCNCADQGRRFKPDCTEQISEYPDCSGRDGHLGKQHGLAAPIQGFGKLFDIGLNAGDLIVQVIVGHDRWISGLRSLFEIAVTSSLKVDHVTRQEDEL